MSYQRIMIIGNVGDEPKIHYLDTGTAVANFDVATTERYKGRDGEQQTHTEWFRCVAWNKTAKLIEEYLHKGDKVFLELRKRERSYESQGATKYITEFMVDTIKLLTPKKQAQPAQPEQPEPVAATNPEPEKKTPDLFDGDEGPDDLPF